jgi:hypothetical protein
VRDCDGGIERLPGVAGAMGGAVPVTLMSFSEAGVVSEDATSDLPAAGASRAWGADLDATCDAIAIANRRHRAGSNSSAHRS